MPRSCRYLHARHRFADDRLQLAIRLHTHTQRERVCVCETHRTPHEYRTPQTSPSYVSRHAPCKRRSKTQKKRHEIELERQRTSGRNGWELQLGSGWSGRIPALLADVRREPSFFHVCLRSGWCGYPRQAPSRATPSESIPDWGEWQGSRIGISVTRLQWRSRGCPPAHRYLASAPDSRAGEWSRGDGGASWQWKHSIRREVHAADSSVSLQWRRSCEEIIGNRKSERTGSGLPATLSMYTGR